MSLFVPVKPQEERERTLSALNYGRLPKMEWGRFTEWIDFRQGDHVTILGPTGSGKTTLARELLRLRDYVVVFATKPADPLLDSFGPYGYKVIREWPPPEPREHFRRILLWPPIDRIEDTTRQARAFKVALDNIYEQGKWCIYWDEARYMIDFLNLRAYSELFWLQSRSIGVSFVVSAQRPAWLPLSAYDQATHLFVAYDSDERNLRRLVEISPVDPDVMRASLRQLGEHDFLYFNTRTGKAAITRIPQRLVRREVA